MSVPLHDQVALITGATAGIGKEIALTFVRQGATVIAVGTNRDRGTALVAEANEIATGKLAFVQTDISVKQDVEALIQNSLQQYQKIDILINNAGITKDGLLLRMAEEDWNRVLAVNLNSCFYTCQSVLKPMLKAKKGRIINISSVVGLVGNPGQCNYAASKAAIIGFSKSLAREVASRSILVNCIAPGFIETPMTHSLETRKDELTKNIPLGRFGLPHEIAETALFLASPGSSYITGQVLVVDGGLAM